MPNDTIERGIKKAAGDGNSVNYEFCTYEGYGPSGTAIIVKCLTDNKNRTAANVRNAFTKGHGSIGTQGCVSYMFDEKGQIIVAKEDYEGDADEDVYKRQVYTRLMRNVCEKEKSLKNARRHRNCRCRENGMRRAVLRKRANARIIKMRSGKCRSLLESVCVFISSSRIRCRCRFRIRRSRREAG